MMILKLSLILICSCISYVSSIEPMISITIDYLNLMNKTQAEAINKRIAGGLSAERTRPFLAKATPYFPEGTFKTANLAESLRIIFEKNDAYLQKHLTLDEYISAPVTWHFLSTETIFNLKTSNNISGYINQVLKAIESIPTYFLIDLEGFADLEDKKIIDTVIPTSSSNQSYVLRALGVFLASHYISFVFYPSTNTWYQINDSSVEKNEIPKYIKPNWQPFEFYIGVEFPSVALYVLTNNSQLKYYEPAQPPIGLGNVCGESCWWNAAFQILFQMNLYHRAINDYYKKIINPKPAIMDLSKDFALISQLL